MGKTTSVGPEARLAAVAVSQHGPFTRRQALRAGFSPATIKRHLGSGRWKSLHRGVYCEAAVQASLERDASAAVLACGPGAAVSHRTAARLWTLDVPVPARPEVSVPVGSRARPPGVLVHRTGRLSRLDAAPRDGIRVTRPMRTLLDLAGVLDADLLELALDQLWRRGHTDPSRLLGFLDDPWCRGKRGMATLRRLVRERLGQGRSGSALETMLLQVIREAGLPPPERQYPVATPFGVRYLDMAYPEHRVAIETDGMESRLDPKVFLDERVRQNLIEAQGWTFRRFGYGHVTEHRIWTAFTIGEALGLRPVRWAGA